MKQHYETALKMAREFVERADNGTCDDEDSDVYRLWDCLNDMIEDIPENVRAAFEKDLEAEAAEA